MARDDDEMFMTRSLNFTPKTTEQHLIVRSDKSVAYGILAIKDCAGRFVLTDTKHRGLFGIAKVLVLVDYLC